MVYQVAERFKSVQGEGRYAGTPMAFIRFVGCSVGKKICQHCDTDFDVMMSWRGGGVYDPEALIKWSAPYDHVCLTGGEPLDQDLEPLFDAIDALMAPPLIHLETSGTQPYNFAKDAAYVCVSPKPGFLESAVIASDEIKVIVPGLGNGAGWPTLEDAIRWASLGKTVFLQPRNGKFDVDHQNLLYVQDVLRDHPQLHLSVQMHKILKVQ